MVASHNSPSPGIVVPHFIVGGLVWLIAISLLILYPEVLTEHYFNPKLLAITHLIVLGWVSMIIFGALYQLIPVIMQTKLYSEKLAMSSFVLLSCGAILLTIAFWNFWLGTFMYVAATFTLVAVSLFVINVLLTSKLSVKKCIEKDFIQTSVIWLLLTVLAGIAVAINLSYKFLSPPHLDLLKLHAHAGIVGWIIQLIMGVGSKLLPMFMISHGLNEMKLKTTYYLTNGGLIIAMPSLYLQWKGAILVSSLLVLSGMIIFLSFLYEAYKKRVKKKLDVGMKQSVLSFIVLTIPMMLVPVLLIDSETIQQNILPLGVAYGSTLCLGFISSLIMGQTYKTLPFIIWLKVYRGKVGKGKNPFPKDLYSVQKAIAQLRIYIIGFAVLLTGIVFQEDIIVRIGGVVLFTSILLYNWNIIRIVLHKYEKNE